MVEHTLTQRGSSRGMDHEAFGALQRELITACQAQQRGTSDARSAYFHRLEELLKPWLSPRALAETEPEIRGQVARLFREAECELDLWVAPEGAADTDQTNFGRFLMRKVFGLS
jgi:hypothetical protein